MQTTQDWAIIFDMDGVIVDSNPFHKKGWQTFCEQQGIALNDATLQAQIYGRTNADAFHFLFGDEMTTENMMAYEKEKEAAFYRLAHGKLPPLPGLQPLLSQLKEAHIPIAIATSAPKENVTFTLQETELASFFPVIIDAACVSHGKPDPEIFLKAAEALQVSPARCVVFEDSFSGITAARAAGMVVVGVATSHPVSTLTEQTDKVVRDFQASDITALKALVPPLSEE